LFLFSYQDCLSVDTIKLRGVRTHNLANIDVDLPRDKLIVITGLSGSGKSSLAFDTIYAEGQRRYVESLSTYARQFLSIMEKPDLDLIEGLSPAISIEQKSSSHNPRSTVGTVTEIYDYLRLLFARIGEPRCPEHDITLKAQTVSQMVDQVMALPEGTRLMLMSPVIRGRKGEHQQLLSEMHAQGYIRARIDGEVLELDSIEPLKKNIKHTIDVVVDRLVCKAGNEQRLAESFETALNLSDGLALVSIVEDEYDGERELLFSAKFSCPHCGYSLPELEPRMFSFNNPHGACPDCDGMGARQYMDPAKAVADPLLSLAEGAIPGWGRRSGYYFAMLEAVATAFDFDIETPYKDLSEEQKNLILFGTGKTRVQFVFNRRGYKRKRSRPFEGVINNRQRRYMETESSSVREYLAKYFSVKSCDTCNGSRLGEGPRHVFVDNHPIHHVTSMPVTQSRDFFATLKLEGHRAEIAEKIILEINARLGFLINVGLNYLTLDRTADTLSGGEAQRIRLASQIGSGLVGVMYILDEPSIGLHQRDNSRLLETLNHLRDIGNTVIVVEHDEETIDAADFVLDIGPGAGKHGGHIIAQGTPAQIRANKDSITGQYLSGQLMIEVPAARKVADKNRWLTVSGASGNNLKQVELKIPVGLLTCITGVSGSGKSTLINATLQPAVAEALGLVHDPAAAFDAGSGLEHLDKIIAINQSPIGRTPRSNPATYTGLFTYIRDIFTKTQEARARGYKPGRFSFNVKGGRCEACKGDGMIRVEMHFLPDVYVACDVCSGSRYNRETLDIQFKGKNIHDVLNMTIEEAADFFSAIPLIKRKLDTLLDVGLGYITLGQSAITLSGGEAQRIKLSRELSKRDTGRTLYLLDEPTTGLHFHDIKQLLKVIHRLRDHGNTIIVIEHNLDVIKTADWIVDLGPEGGDGGGEIIASGTPEEVAGVKASYTGQYLKPMLGKR
jgi:excinuclease ABC subunit A